MLFFSTENYPLIDAIRLFNLFITEKEKIYWYYIF
ncbi:hypothetical protein HDE70_003033 [Pedobacter cryoconitis]|nr:hypothetical protein [Pedobacter cryoconitis]